MKTGLPLTEVDVRIAAIRENLEELVEQSAADSSAGHDDLNAARIAEQEKELAELTELRGSCPDWWCSSVGASRSRSALSIAL